MTVFSQTEVDERGADESHLLEKLIILKKKKVKYVLICLADLFCGHTEVAFSLLQDNEKQTKCLILTSLRPFTPSAHLQASLSGITVSRLRGQ